MKKIVLISILAMCLPWTLAAQSVDDDLYYIPSKKKKEQVRVEKKKAAEEVVVLETNAPTKVYADAASTTVVVRDRSKKKMDIDSYNRRYTADEHEFSRQNDTLYIDTRSDSDLDGEWVNGEFSGSADDYEYATRIIRFRNPRYAVSISSPMYWDIVYGLNSWEWNVYTDGLYAYAFPTFSNRYWWDWRYNSYGWGWSSWWGPSWSFSWNWGWGGWYNPCYGPHYHHHHHYYPGWNHGYWSNSVYTNRRSYGPSFSRRNSYGSTGIRNAGVGTPRRSSGISTGGTARRSASTVNGGQTVRRSSSAANGQQVRRGNASTGTSRRVIGTRTPNGTRPNVSTDRNTNRRTVYVRPSSTRSRVDRNGQVQDVRRSGATRRADVQNQGSTYRRGSSSSVRNNNNTDRNSRRSNYNSRSMNSNTRSSSSFSSGGSFRSSGGFSGGGSSRSSRGGSERRR